MSETQFRQPALPEILIWLLNRAVLLWQQVVMIAQQIMAELHIYDFMDMAAVYMVQHPVMALFLLAMALCCGIPILMFVVFAVISVILTFTGFIVIEGTILTIGSVVLCGFLLGMVVVMIALAATIGVAYFGFMEVYGLLQNSPESSPVARYLSSHLTRLDSRNHQTPSNQQLLDNIHED
ncbi:lipid droplet assembly factor 1-B [Periplaneta americana]|uniref:lipid droplet assembly factor 1-B n=1 Tax=Periplaneta americana TaxID=6978 RepID=UPI0037E767E8